MSNIDTIKILIALASGVALAWVLEQNGVSLLDRKTRWRALRTLAGCWSLLLGGMWAIELVF